MNDSSNQAALTVRCRLIPDFNLSAGFITLFTLFFIGMAIMQPLKPSEIEALVLALALTLPAPLYWLIARLRGAIILTESGVRWRTAFSGWKTARWDEVESCDMRVTSTTTQWKFVVFTRNGAFSWTKAFQNAEQLAPFASRFCPQIPAEIENWPRFFSFRSAENWMFPVGVLLFGSWLIAPLWMLFSSSPREWMAQISSSAALVGWPLTLLCIVAFPCVMLLIPGSMLLISWRVAKQKFSHRDETFVATPDGLIWYRAGHEPLLAAWPELQILHIETTGKWIELPECRITTAHSEFNWSAGLSGQQQFRRTLHERAPQLQETTAENLKSSLSPAPRRLADAVIFDFKTRELRAISWFWALFSLSCLGVALLGPILTPSDQDSMPLWFFVLSFVSIGAATFYCLMLFSRGTIRLDSRGIEWKVPLKNRFVAWQEIEAVNLGRNAFLRVGDKKLSLSGAGFLPAHFDVLVKEIENRTLQARQESNEISSHS